MSNVKLGSRAGAKRQKGGTKTTSNVSLAKKKSERLINMKEIYNRGSKNIPLIIIKF